jgi:hypothetical protein
MQNPQQYADHIAMHEKCLGILRMREAFVQRLNSAEDFLSRFDAAGNWDPIRLMNYRWQLEHRVELLKYTVERITGYYERLSAKMCTLLHKPAFKGFLDTIYYGKGHIAEYNSVKWKEVLDSFPINTEMSATSIPVFGRIEKGLNDFNVIHQGNDFTVEPVNVPYEEHYASGPGTGYQ